MLSDFALLPPEANSARIYAGMGPGSMLAAAASWDELATELRTAAASFVSMTSRLADGAWQGAAALAMTQVAESYVSWLSASGTAAERTASLARSAAAEFESALAATVHPASVAATRVERAILLSTNLFGQNTPAIAAVESLYDDMWAQDVAAMADYYAGASTVVAQLEPWQLEVQGLLDSAIGLRFDVSNGNNANAAAAQTVAQVMGGSGIPIPSSGYLRRAGELYIQRSIPDFLAQSLFTPEGLYPVTAIKSLTFDVSVAQGVAILDASIRQQLAVGNNVTVFGFSQSATIASLEMTRLASSLNPPAPDQLSFTLVGNPGNPNGGVAARFPGVSLPSLGVTSPGATPANLYPTRMYSIEYDGVADFPRYPINVLSTLNAIFGTYYLHNNYLLLTPQQIDAAIPLTNTAGPTMTEYYMIPTPNLPLLEPLRALPMLGNPLADLLQPNLKVIVNLGYGDPNYGYSTSPPNVPTPFGLFPDVDPMQVIGALGTGSHQGISDFGYGITHLDLPPAPDMANLLAPTSAAGGSGLAAPADLLRNSISDLKAANIRFTTTATNIVATGYATLLPTADIANAMLTTAPAYNVDLFLDGIEQAANGNPMGLVNAIGYPIAADVALLSAGAGLQGLILVSAAEAILYYAGALAS